jgi:hypothetical protein
VTTPDCTPAGHERLKANQEAWAGLELLGRQEVPGFDDEAAYELELRQCACGSTLAVEVAP